MECNVVKFDNNRHLLQDHYGAFEGYPSNISLNRFERIEGPFSKYNVVNPF